MKLAKKEDLRFKGPEYFIRAENEGRGGGRGTLAIELMGPHQAQFRVSKGKANCYQCVHIMRHVYIHLHSYRIQVQNVCIDIVRFDQIYTNVSS